MTSEIIATILTPIIILSIYTYLLLKDKWSK